MTVPQNSSSFSFNTIINFWHIFFYLYFWLNSTEYSDDFENCKLPYFQTNFAKLSSENGVSTLIAELP